MRGVDAAVPDPLSQPRPARRPASEACANLRVDRRRWAGTSENGPGRCVRTAVLTAAPAHNRCSAVCRPATTFEWSEPGGFASLTGLRRRSTPSPRGSACRALRLCRLGDDPATGCRQSVPRSRPSSPSSSPPAAMTTTRRTPARRSHLLPVVGTLDRADPPSRPRRHPLGHRRWRKRPGRADDAPRLGARDQGTLSRRRRPVLLQAMGRAHAQGRGPVAGRPGMEPVARDARRGPVVRAAGRDCGAGEHPAEGETVSCRRRIGNLHDALVRDAPVSRPGVRPDMLIVKPYGRSETVFDGDDALRRKIRRNVDGLPADDLAELASFAESHPELVLAQWISAIDKIAAKPKPGERPTAEQRRLRETLGRAALDLLNEEGFFDPSEKGAEHKRLWRSKIHPYGKEDDNEAHGREKGRWYARFAGRREPRDIDDRGRQGDRREGPRTSAPRGIPDRRRPSEQAARPDRRQGRKHRRRRAGVAERFPDGERPWSEEDRREYEAAGDVASLIRRKAEEKEKERGNRRVSMRTPRRSCTSSTADCSGTGTEARSFPSPRPAKRSLACSHFIAPSRAPTPAPSRSTGRNPSRGSFRRTWLPCSG